MPETNELSQRECEILTLVAKGASNKEIARDLHISTNTVKVHLRNIFSKVDANSRTEAAMYAVNAGIVEIKPGAAAAGQEVEEQRSTNKFLIGIAITVSVIIISLLGFLAFQGSFSGNRETNNQPGIPVEAGWEERAQLPSARKGLALASYDGEIFAIAGETDEGISSSVEHYDPVSDQWSSLDSKPTPVADVSAVVIAGKIYVPGGLTPSGDLSDALEIYSLIDGAWEQGADLPLGISAYALVAYEGNMYLFGGWDGSEYLNSVYQYDPEQDQWLSKTPMSTARGYSGAAVSGGKIFVVGGYDGDKGLSSMEVYIPELDDLQSNPWSKGTDLPVSRFGMGVAGLGNMIHVVGGKIGEGGSQSSMVYSPQEGIWQEFDSPTTES
ncbi:unnamed protein product, partial [marine sediment metagenome]